MNRSKTILTVLAIGALAVAGSAGAAGYPDKTVNYIIPFGPGGESDISARLQEPVQSKCLTRFSLDWAWDGKPALIQSRAMDETGYVQPTYGELRKVRGTRSIYHNHSIQTWLVQESGEVKNVQLG